MQFTAKHLNKEYRLSRPISRLIIGRSDLVVNVSFATIQIAMLALPGLIWASIDASTSHRARSIGFLYWVKVFVSGVACYAILALFYRWTGASFDAFELGNAESIKFSDKADEIAWSVPISLILALSWTASRTHQVFPKILRFLNISDHSGCDDIWEYALGSASPVGNWVHFRDFDNQVIYEGWVKAYSDGPEVRELLLAHVSVYGFDGDKLYDQHALYISRPTSAINLEFCLENENEQAA